MDIVAKDFFTYISLHTDFEDLSEKFGRLNTNAKRLDFVYQLLQEFKFLPQIKIEKKKNPEAAQWMRKEGNHCFACQDYKRALWKYNESLNFAPLESEELGLAYANRSAVLFQLEWYKECLEDIEHAFANNYPSNLKDKLERRKKNAKLLIKKSKTFTRHEEILKFVDGPHPQIKCAGNCVEVKSDYVFGKQVVATKNINVGDVVVMEEPFVKVLNQEHYLTHCYHCLKPCINLVPCQNCPLVMFCDEQCRDTAWCYHKSECPVLEHLLKMNTPIKIFNALRIAIQIKSLPKKKQAGLASDYLEIHRFAKRHQKPSHILSFPAVRAALVYHAVLASGGLKNRDENLFKELLYLHSKTANKHIISLEECDLSEVSTNTIGSGIFSFLSLMNHSCNPNLLLSDFGNHTVAIALQPIPKGKQLFRCYTEPYYIQDMLSRHTILTWRYGITCTCNACVYHWPIVAIDPLLGAATAALISIIPECKDLNIAKQMLSEFQRDLKATRLPFRPIQDDVFLQICFNLCYRVLGNKRLY